MSILKKLQKKGYSYSKTISDGDVQRHIFSLHRGFHDSWRICGDFAIVCIPPNLIRESEWDLDEGVVSEYAEKFISGSEFPPVVVDYHGSFIDGGHRHLAALKAKAPTITVYIQINNEQEFPF